MGLLNKIFGSDTNKREVVKSDVNWISLNAVTQLEEIKNLSKNEYIIIFKHSTGCGISRGVLKQFEKSFDQKISKLKVYYLDLLNYRDVSNQVGYQFQVIHESPQLLIIKDGVAVEHASHYDIMSIDLKKYI